LIELIGKLKNIFEKINLIKSDTRSGELYAVSALFDTPNQIMAAADKVASSGYKKFDVLTPYPVHGMDDAMKMKESKVGWFAFGAGITGTTLAFLMIGWMVGIDYKNVFGGKPFFNIAPSIPIAFEITVLLAALTVAGAMIALFNKLPWNSNPLMDTNFMKHCTSDKYGIYIEAADEKFNQTEVASLFQSLESSTVEAINYPVLDDTGTKNLVTDKKFMGGLAAISIVTGGITYFVLNILLFLPPFDWMHLQDKVKPQTSSTFFADGYSMRTPVEGTVARNFIPYEYKGMHDSLVKYIANPLQFNEQTVEKGKQRFDTYCSPCHGYYGKGDSRLKGQFPNPPTLHSEKIRNWPDAKIYHVITNGQNVMPSYEKQILRDDRWAIIHYLRVLQRSQNAPDSDFEGK